MSTKPFLLASLGLAALAGCADSISPAGTASVPRSSEVRTISRASRNGINAYIQNVVVIIQENRSFENFFAGYPGANAPMIGCAGGGSGPARDSGSGCPTGDIAVPLHPIGFINSPDLPHSWRPAIHDWNKGKMDGFYQFGNPRNGKYAAYAYVKRSLVTPYWDMAQQYVLADAMFPTEFGGSFTGHLTLIAGTDNLNAHDDLAEVNFPSAVPDDCDSPPGTRSWKLNAKRRADFDGPFPCFTQFNTMAQALDAAKVSWKIYATKVLDAGMWEPFEAIKYVRYGPDWHTNIIAPQKQILSDPGDGQLASVSWVTPSKLDSDHPGNNSTRGPSWVASIVNAIGESPYWKSSAIIVVWDDWGGWYDNAAPPQLDFRGLAIRVPCLIISPYAKQGYVSHTQYEFGSILKFIEEAFPGVGPIGPTSEGYTDTRANSLVDSFDFTQNPRTFTPIKLQYPSSTFVHEPRSNEAVDNE